MTRQGPVTSGNSEDERVTTGAPQAKVRGKGARRRSRKPSPSLKERVRSWARRAAVAVWAAPASPPPATAEDRRARRGAVARHHLLPLLLYILIALVMTYPLVRHFATGLAGNGFDAWQNLWNFWWTREALAGGRDPYWMPLVYAPYGAPLYLHTLNLFNGLVSLPVQLLFGLVAAYNATVILSFVLAAYFASLLVARVSGSRPAGFVGGVIYGFGAYGLSHFFYGQTNLLASEWLPAYILCLLAATGATGRRRTLLVGVGALALALLMLCDWQYVVFAALFTAVYAGYRAAAWRSSAPPLVAAAIGLLWLPLAAPVLLPTLGAIRGGFNDLASDAFVAQYSADLLSLVLPSPRQWWWRALAGEDGGSARTYDRAASLGFLPLALAAWGVWRGRRRAIFWVVVALLFGLLALGPTLRIAGQTAIGGGDWTVPLPYRLLRQLPALNIARVPSRFALVVTLCLAALAGLGIAGPAPTLRRAQDTGGLARRFPAPRGPRARLVLPALLVVALLAEQFAAPFAVEPAGVPPAYGWLARSGELGAILELPFSRKNPEGLFYQTAHRRPLVGGYLSRDLPYPLLDLPPFPDLANRPARPDIVADPPGLEARALAFAGVRWVVVFLDDARLDRSPLADFLARHVEPEPVYRDARFAIYRPRAPDDPAMPAFAVRPGEGWYEPEALTDGRARMRWFRRAAALNLWNFGAAPQPVTLRFDAWSFRTARRLAVSVDGHDVGQWSIAEPQRVAIPLTLAPGQHRVELRALDPPARPVDAGIGDDPRPLAFGVTALAVEPRR